MDYSSAFSYIPCSNQQKTAYNPRVEAISPTLPCEETQPDYNSTFRTSKDELLQNIDKIDREISQTAAQISELRERKKQLEAKAASRDSLNDVEKVDNSAETRQLSIAQLVYSENRRKARESHDILTKFGPNFDLPLYHQPSDSPVYHQNIEKFKVFKPRLIKYFKKRHEEKKANQKYLLETYERLMSKWLKKLEKNELNPGKKAKDNKTREFFEKQFPELKKQREDRERLSRAGQRIRSDADLEEIMDGLQEQELEDRKMRSCAVIPPIMQDNKTRRHKFINFNGLVENPLEKYKEIQLVNIWLDHEKDIFREKFLQHPKNFGLIASYLERKTVPDCVHYYYLSKKRENYKMLLRKQVRKKTRSLVKQLQQQHQQHQQQQQQQAQQPTPQQSDPKGQADIDSAQLVSGTGINSESTQNVIVNDINKCSSNSKGDPKDSSNSEIQAGVSSAVTLPLSAVNSGTEGADDQIGKKDLNSDTQKADEKSNRDNFRYEEFIRCFVCENAIFSHNIAQCSSITKSNSHLYGIHSDKVKEESKVCLNCAFRHIRKECPIQSCKTTKRKVKRLKLLPQQWFDLSNDLKQSIAKEMNIPPDIRKCCTRCVIRISRRIGAISPLLTYTKKSFANEFHDWKDEEIVKLEEALSTKGKNWFEVSSIIGSKSAEQCKEFYFNYKYKLDLNKSIERYWSKCGDSNAQASDSEDYFKDNSEDDSEATSSADEGVEKSNSEMRRSNSPPINTVSGENVSTTTTNSTIPTTTPVTNESATRNSSTSGDGSDMSGCPENKLNELRAISTSQGSLKSDYDSSATVSADEGRGNGEEDMRSSPPSSKVTQRSNSVMPNFPPSNHVVLPDTERVRPVSHEPAFTQESMMNHPNRPMEGLAAAQQRYRAPPYLIHHDPSLTRSNNSTSLPRIKTENILGPPGLNYTEDRPRNARDLIDKFIETSFRAPTTTRPSVNLPPHVLDGNPPHPPRSPFNSNNLSVPSVSPSPNRESHPMMMNNSPVPIYSPQEIKKEMPSEPCKFGANIKLSTSNDIRIPRFNSHPYVVKPEGLAMMASYPSTYPPGVPYSPAPPSGDPDNEIQDLSKKTRKLDDDYPQSHLPPTKRERYDSSMRGNDFKKSPVPAHMTPTPPPAHSNQIQRTSIHDLPVSNISTAENTPISRPVEPPRLESRNFMHNDGFSPMMVHGPSGSPLLRHAIRAPTIKTPHSNPSPVTHTPPPPLITSNKSYQMPSGSQLSPKPPYRDKMMPSQMVSGSGSITQGTPIIMAQHGPLHSNQFNQQHYERLLRQLAPTYPKDSGSITLGTPVPQDSAKRKNEPSMHDLNKPYPGPGIYEPNPIDSYYRRFPESTMPYPPHPHPPPTQSPYHGSPINFPPNEGHMKNKFLVESQSSSNQIMIDFNTSKQMQPRQPSSSDVKESHSISSLLGRPADSSPHISPQGRVPPSMYPFGPPSNMSNIAAASGMPQVNLGNNDKYPNPNLAPRLIPSNPSRSSPTQEHWMSKTGPPSGYPIVSMAKRQGVIQQYSTPSSKQSVIQSVKSNSPREGGGMRADPWSSRSITSTGYSDSHDAFKTLVDAAVARSSLPTSREEQHRMILPRNVHQPSKSPSTDRQSSDQMNKNLMEIQRSRSAHEGSIKNRIAEKMRLLETDKHCVIPNPEHQQLRDNHPEDKFIDNKYLPGPSTSSSPQTLHRLPFTKEAFEKELRQQDMRSDSSGRKSVEAVEIQNSQNKKLSPDELGSIEASRIFSQSFQKDEPRNHSTSNDQISAHNLIETIITRSINQSDERPNRESQQSSDSGENKPGDLRPIVSMSNEITGNYQMNVSNRHHEKDESSSKSFGSLPKHFDQQVQQQQQQQQRQQQQPQHLSNPSDKDDQTDRQNFKDRIANIISKSYSDDASKLTPIAQPVCIIPCSQENNPSNNTPPPPQVQPTTAASSWLSGYNFEPISPPSQPTESRQSSPTPDE